MKLSLSKFGRIVGIGVSDMRLIYFCIFIMLATLSLDRLSKREYLLSARPFGERFFEFTHPMDYSLIEIPERVGLYKKIWT
jgi:hypothetical protein